jgi:putative nucleotidyltransferase with HDIG domain
MPAAAVETLRTTYTSVPLSGLVAKDPVPFPLYLSTAEHTWVLYRPAAAALDESHLGRLHSEGVEQLFIRDADRGAYFSRVEHALDQILLERNMPLERRADVLQGVAVHMAEDLLCALPDKVTMQRAQRVMMATSGLMLREAQGFAAIRRVMAASSNLATHSLTVSFLAMGLARIVLAADASTLVVAGLAGLLHDVGKVGHEGLDHDPEHTTRGAEYLKGLALPVPVIEAARSHHERWDGSGFPLGLRGSKIPEFARIVGLVNTFDKVYSAQQPRVGVFDALRILAQAYRGCFDDRVAQGFVRLFR